MLLATRAIAAQPTSDTGPPLSEVEATWTAFWNHVSLGDVPGAVTYLHSSRRDVLPPTADLRKLQEVADQMAFCRIEPNPIQIRKDEVWYPVHCRRCDETAEAQLGMRRDVDGVWRISVF